MSGPARGHQLIAEARRRLADRPEFVITERDGHLEVAPPIRGGFPVALSVEPECFSVYLGGWHQSFESARDALNCFVYGLRGDCRLRVRYRGGTACKWTLEHRRDGQWVPESSKGRLLIPFWRRSRETLLSNR